MIDGPSAYGYALQNPIRFPDPSGQVIPFVALGYAAGGALVGYSLGELADYVEENNCKCKPLPDPGILIEALAGAIAADSVGQGVGKRFRTRRSARGSSLLSSELSKLFPGRMKRRWPTPRLFPPGLPYTPWRGRAIGRLVPWLTLPIIGYDLYRIYRCL